MEAISCQKNMWGAVVHIAKHVPSLFMSIAKGVSLDIKLERDIQKAKCKIKICCINNNLNSCADCLEYTHCPIVNEFYNKNGYKYRKYKQATEYIKQHGYKAFFEIADTWKNAYGKY